MENITENNQLIAEFMGVFDKILSTGNIHSWSDSPFYYTTEDTREKVIKNISKYSKYSKDWNWLMRVVEKIEKIPEKNDNWFNVTVGASCYCIIQDATGELSFEIIGDGRTKIEATYNACIEFIKWYNEQNKK